MKRTCKNCGRFIEENNEFCIDCLKAMHRKNTNQIVYKTIVDEWRLEAKDEESKYFYFVDEVKDILSGKKSFVIGRKGEGKTAIAQYISHNKSYNHFTDIMSFKDFPFNVLYQLSNNSFTRPSQYISIWKLLIYTSICKKMIINENIDSEIVIKLKKIFPEEDNRTKLSKLIKKYTINDFGLQILGSGINVGGDRNKPDMDWIQIIDILESTILENIDDSNYYILFDELDEDYKNFINDSEKQSYFDLITGLFKAVQDVKNTFRERKLNVYPIIFLRTDIFNYMTYSDKNKWSDLIINLVWTPEKIKKLLAHRLNTVFKTSNYSFDDSWSLIFSNDTIPVGNRKRKQINSFDYILRSTQNRPRDFIKYFQECAKQAIEYNVEYIEPKIIKLADNEFSEYLKSEIIDEIYSVLPEYEDIFAILSLIRKQTFNPIEFVEKYNQMVENKEIYNRGAEQVLKMLFEYSVIGNVPSIKNQAIFKYEKSAARFNFKEKIIIHRGLFKALQIF